LGRNEQAMMRFLFLFLFLISSIAYANPRILVADEIQSSDLTKTWLMPPVSGTLATSTSAWSLAGNAGTGGTGVLGTTDAQPWSTIANGIFVDAYQTDGTVSSIQNFTPVDGNNHFQKNNQTNLNSGVATTTANFSNQANSVGYSGGFDFAGNITNESNGLGHNGTEHIGYMSNVSNNSNFASAGTLDIFKGIDMNVGIGTGYTITNYNGIFSSANSTGGIFGSFNLFGGGAGFTDINSGNIQGVSFNLNIDGASVLTQGAQSYSSSLNVSGSTTAVNNLQGSSNTISINNTVAANGGVTGNNTNIQFNDNSTANHTNVLESDLSINNAAVVSGVAMHQINFQTHGTAQGQNGQGINNGLTMDGSSQLDSYSFFNSNAQISGTPTITNNLTFFNAGSNITGGTFGGIGASSMPLTVGGTSAITGLYEGSFTNIVLNGAATTGTMIGSEVDMTTDNTAVVAGQMAGSKISIQTNGVPHNNSLEGLEINLSGAVLDPAYLATGGQKNGIVVNDGTFSTGYNYDIPSASTFVGINQFGSNLNVVNGTPVTALAFVNNFGTNYTLHDNWTIGGFGIGPVNISAVGALAIDPTFTLDEHTGMISGLTNPSGAGTLTSEYNYRAAGVINQGGTLTATNVYGFSTFTAAFGSVGTNVWAFYDDTIAENHVNKLAIGTATKKVANASTALEIGNSKALLNGRGNTATKNLLTAVAGMQFYDTTLDQLQYYNGTSWVAVATPTETQETPAGTVDSVNVTFTLAHVPVSNAAVKLYIDGTFATQGTDYTIAGATITMASAPLFGQSLDANYTY